MRKNTIILFLFAMIKVVSQVWKTEDQYIQKFAPYAVEEMEKYKIPASITLAQGLLETAGGQSRLAQEGKNHFGIKCKENWTGKTMAHTDDAPNECFRVYDDPKQSYEDHSKFLAERKYYVKLFQLDPKDYKSWAHGLKKAGYATNPKYAYILIDKIEKYKLYEFDNTDSKSVYAALMKMYPTLSQDPIFIAKADKNPTNAKPTIIDDSNNKNTYTKIPKIPEKKKSSTELLNSIFIKNHPNNNIKFIIIPTETTVAFISKKYGIREDKLIKWNELSNGILKKNDILFLEPKSTMGNVETYTAQSGDTMHHIAQKFALKLHKLYRKNRMEEGEQPKVGQLMYLQEKKPRN